MSNVIVKENETLDSALRRFKRSCAKAGIQQEIRKESITRNQAFVVRKNLKPQENVNIINCAQKSLAAFSQGFLNPQYLQIWLIVFREELIFIYGDIAG